MSSTDRIEKQSTLKAPLTSRSHRAPHSRQVAPLFAVLRDETRLALVSRLARQGPQSITHLGDVAPLSRQAITKHLGALERVGLVKSRRSGRRRVFELRPERLDEVHRYLDEISGQWDSALGRLQAMVERDEELPTRDDAADGKVGVGAPLSDLDRDLAPSEAGRFLSLAAAYMRDTRVGEGSVSTPLSRDELYALFDEPLPVDGVPLEALAHRVASQVVPNSNRLFHPMSMGHQVSPPLPAAVWMEPLIGALNQSTAVAEMSPAATAIETRVIRWMCAAAGFGEGAGGTITTGGTEATFTALLAARNALVPDAWERGLGTDPPAIVCGEHAHYSVMRAAGELGIGTRRAVAVPSRDHRMDTAALVAMLDRLTTEGVRVMAVVATAGSTATGSFDDLETIGRLCSERGLWLHVDAAHGGSALLSERHRPRLEGIEHARTIAWDPHKMMLVPLGTGMVLARDERDLERAFSQSAPYLFHTDEGTRRWDQGTRSFMCSRRADALKLWAALQRYGSRGIGRLYDHLCSTAHRLWELVGERDDFMAFHEPESNILCFRWVGAPGLSDEQLDEVNLRVRERWNRERGWITTTVLDGARALRVTLMNVRTEEAHLREMLEGIARLGRESL